MNKTIILSAMAGTCAGAMLSLPLVWYTSKNAPQSENQFVEDAAYSFVWHESWVNKYNRWQSEMWSKIRPHHICCRMKRVIDESRPEKAPLQWDVGDFHTVECPTVTEEHLGSWMAACSDALAKKSTLTQEEWTLKQDIEALRKEARQLVDDGNKSWFVQHLLKVFCRGSQTPEGMVNALSCIANPLPL